MRSLDLDPKRLDLLAGEVVEAALTAATPRGLATLAWQRWAAHEPHPPQAIAAGPLAPPNDGAP